MKHYGLQYCPSCGKEVNILQHKCYLQPVTHEKKQKRNDEQPQHTIFVYFDIEARQDTGNHVTNLLCAETDQNNVQFTFEGKGCVSKFIQWVHSKANREDVEKVIVVAHHFKGYDGYFILEELYKQRTTNLQQNVNGAKILSLELPHIKFIDSMNFFPMALANFPKTLGIAHVMNKGERRLVDGSKSFLVDGYDEQTKTVYEFQGCGCITCFPDREMKHPIHQNKTMREVREETRRKIQQLSQLGYQVKEMWNVTGIVCKKQILVSKTLLIRLTLSHR